MSNPLSDTWQGVVRALAMTRDRLGRSPPEVVDALLAALKHADNSGNPWDDSAMTACHLEALGHLVPATTQVCWSRLHPAKNYN